MKGPWSRLIRILLPLLVTGSAGAQDGTLETAGEWAWTTITVTGGVRVSYVYYEEADSGRDGVVLRLDNRNAWPVTYRFTAIFRSGDERVEERVEGRIAARSIVTGDGSGLFFVPFPAGTPIGEIGLRGIHVDRADERRPAEAGRPTTAMRRMRSPVG